MSVIHVITEYDLLMTRATSGDYYACTDSKKLYKDISDNVSERRLVKAVMLNTDSERLYDIRPCNGKLYYVWETNELWLYDYGWQLKVGSRKSSNAYQLSDGYIVNVSPVSRDNPIDNNGLLEDGSVIVRDINRIIKGRLYTDVTNNNLVVSSYLGAGMTLYPNGEGTDTGSLRLYNQTKELSEDSKSRSTSLETKGVGWFEGEWNTTDDIWVNKNGGTVEPSTVPTGHDTVVIKTFTEREATTTDLRTYILRHDFTITIDSEGIAKVELLVTDNSNKKVSTEVVDQDNNVTTELVETGTIISTHTMTASRSVEIDSNYPDYPDVIFTLDDNTVITVYSLAKGSDTGTNAIVDYRHSSIHDDAPADKILTYATSEIIHRYLLWHEGNFDFDKYITPEKILTVLQKNDPPLDLTVMYLGKLDEDGNLIRYSPDDFALKEHKHNSGSFVGSTEAFKEEDLIGIDYVIYNIVRKVINKGKKPNQRDIQITIPQFNEGMSIEDMAISFKTGTPIYNIKDGGVTQDIINDENIASEYRTDVMGQMKIDLNNNTADVVLRINPYGHKHLIKEMEDYDDLLDMLEGYVPISDTSKLGVDEIAGIAHKDKLIYTDGNGYLPVNITGKSNETRKLDHELDIVLFDTECNEEIGSANNENFEDDKVTINVKINGKGHTHDRYVLSEGVTPSPDESNNDQAGVTIPTLDRDTGIIKEQYLPKYVRDAMFYVGEFNPADDYPENNKIGAVYSAANCGYIPSKDLYYKTGDIIVNLGSGKWLTIRNGQAEDNIYAFDTVPNNPGFYNVDPASNTSPIVDDKINKWGIIVTKASRTEANNETPPSEKFIQIAIRTDGRAYTRVAEQKYTVESKDIPDKLGNITTVYTYTRDRNEFTEWKSLGTKIINFDYDISTVDWSVFDEDNSIYKAMIDITRANKDIIAPEVARYNIYALNQEQLVDLENVGVSRMYIINEDGVPYIYAKDAKPDTTIYLQIEIVPISYYLDSSILE